MVRARLICLTLPRQTVGMQPQEHTPQRFAETVATVTVCYSFPGMKTKYTIISEVYSMPLVDMYSLCAYKSDTEKLSNKNSPKKSPVRAYTRGCIVEKRERRADCVALVARACLMHLTPPRRLYECSLQNFWNVCRDFPGPPRFVMHCLLLHIESTQAQRCHKCVFVFCM